MKRINFPTLYFIYNNIYLITYNFQIPEKTSNVSIVQPFRESLWLILLASVHFIAVIVWLLDRYSPMYKSVSLGVCTRYRTHSVAARQIELNVQVSSSYRLYTLSRSYHFIVLQLISYADDSTLIAVVPSTGVRVTVAKSKSRDLVKISE